MDNIQKHRSKTSTNNEIVQAASSVQVNAAPTSSFLTRRWEPHILPNSMVNQHGARLNSSCFRPASRDRHQSRAGQGSRIDNAIATGRDPGWMRPPASQRRSIPIPHAITSDRFHIMEIQNSRSIGLFADPLTIVRVSGGQMFCAS